MANTEILKKNGEAFYPITSTGCLVDEDGNSVDITALLNKTFVTSISSSTDDEIPSAKCIYILIGNIESVIAAIRGV